MEKTPFHQLLGFAWRLSRRSRILWFFGFFLALSPPLNNLIFSRFFPEVTAENWRLLLSSFSGHSLPLVTLLLVLVFLLRVFGKSSLIVALPLALPQAKLPLHFKTLSPSKLFKIWKQALSLEVLIFFFLLFLAIILSAPALFSYFYKPAVFDTLLLLSGATFFVLALLTFFVKELAFFYMLLSQLGIRASLENAYELFARFLPRCVAFGAYSLAVLLLFTFFLDLFILTFGELLRLPAWLTLGVSLFFLTWFSILYRALWFFFFRDLATPPAPPEKVEMKKELLLKEKIPEIPSVENKGV